MIGKEMIASTLQEQRNKLVNQLFVYCNSLAKAEKLSELSKWHRKIIFINPSDPKLYFRIAEDFRGYGLYDLAISYYNATIDLHDKYAQAYYGRAFCYFMLGEKILALPDTEKANFYCHDNAELKKQARDLHAEIVNNLLADDEDNEPSHRM